MTASRKCWWLLVVGLLVIVAVAIVAGVGASSGSDSAGSKSGLVISPQEPTAAPSISSLQPAQAPSSAPTKLFRSERFETLFVMLTPSITVDKETSFLRDPETPQSQALEWLADKDPAHLDLKEMPLKTFLERYALAVLFLGTLGESWRDSLGFLTSTSVSERNNNLGGSDGGVFCDQEAGSVIELQLSKFELCVHIAMFGYVFD